MTSLYLWSELESAREAELRVEWNTFAVLDYVPAAAPETEDEDPEFAPRRVGRFSS